MFRFLRRWVDYDPSWLVVHAEKQLKGTEDEHLIEAIKLCTRASYESDLYIHFVDPSNPNEPKSEWQYERSIILVNTQRGHVVVDVLKDGRIGGLDFAL